MAIVETNVCAPGHNPVLTAMFEARKQVFVDLLRWDVPVVGARFEIDQFDDGHATYIIIAGEDGRHLGSARLLKTIRPHILGTLYQELCEGPVPTGPATYEITRFCLDRGQGAAMRLKTRNRLVSAIVAHSLARGIATCTGVAEMGWFQQILAFGWDCRPLGPPRTIGGRTLGALAIAIDAGTPALLTGNGLWIEDERVPCTLARAA